jgi:hypothetical protein
MALALFALIVVTAFQGWTSPSSPRVRVFPRYGKSEEIIGYVICAGQTMLFGLTALLLYRRLLFAGKKSKSLWWLWASLNLTLILALFAVFCISCAANVNWNAFI